MTNNLNKTSADFWNERWHASQISLINSSDTYWGSDGIFLRVMRRHLGSLDNKQIIEFGGANSLFLLALTKWENAEVTAVDYSKAGIEKLIALFKANNCSVTAVYADIFSWDPAGKKYDLVVHWGLLEHFTDPAAVMAVCKKVLSPNGRIVFTMPNMEAWGAALWRKWSPENWKLHIYHSDKVIEEACESTNLKVVKKFYWGRPMLQRTLWEKNGLLPSTVTVIQRGINLINKAVPIYRFGARKLSTQRGFVVQHH